MRPRLPRVLRRLIACFTRGARDREMDQEMAFHLESIMRDYVRAGMSEAEAAREARRRFGNPVRLKEQGHDITSARLLDDLVRDLRHAARGLRRTPGVAIAVVSMLALAIGANTAIFSVAKAVVLTPMPFRDPDRVVLVFDGNKGEHYQPGAENILMTVRPSRFQHWREHCRSFDSMAIVLPKRVIVNVGDRTVATDAFMAGEGYFELLGTPAEIGRTLKAGDYGSDGGRVAVLSHQMWRERYDADPSVIGRDIVVDRAAYQIVGVMPRGFHPTRTMKGDDPQLWLPELFDPVTKYSPTLWGHNVYARLKPGVTLAQAQADLDAVEIGLSATRASRSRGYSIVAPVAGYVYGHHERVFWLLLASVGLVLVIACANVANLLLARALEREQEFAVRAALGASRGAIVRQVLVESMLLAGLAGAIGVALSRILTPPVVALLPATSGIPRLDQVQVDAGVLLFTLFISILAGLLFGLAPAVRLGGDRASALSGWRGTSIRRRERRLSDALIVIEVALSLLLLTAGGLFVQTFLKLLRADPGFRPAQSVALRVTIPANRYAQNPSKPQPQPRQQLQQLFDRLEQTIQAVPDVERVGVTRLLPLRQFWDPEALSIEGRPPLPPDKFGVGGVNSSTGLPNHGTIAVQSVTSGYFSALGIRLVRGRLFDDHDRPDAPMAALINESAARKFFPDEDPIGKRVVRGQKSTIVGIVGDTRLTGMDREVPPELYWPLAYALPNDSAWVVARARQGDDTVVDAVRRAIAQVDPDLGISEMTSMTSVVSDSLWRQRVAALLVGVFAMLAMVIATCGLYAIISYAVTRRTRELGVRLALGASGTRIATLVVGHGLRVTAVGIILGGVVAAVVSRIADRAVPEGDFSQWDVTHLSIQAQASPSLGDVPWIVPAVAVLLVALTLVACWVPLRRALAVDPIAALRAE